MKSVFMIYKGRQILCQAVSAFFIALQMKKDQTNCKIHSYRLTTYTPMGIMNVKQPIPL